LSSYYFTCEREDGFEVEDVDEDFAQDVEVLVVADFFEDTGNVGEGPNVRADLFEEREDRVFESLVH
jgi:hypothetical protein